MRAFAFIRWSGAPVWAAVKSGAVSTPNINVGGVNVPSIQLIPGITWIEANNLGHVAWAFEVTQDNFLCGSLENISGSPFVRGNQQENKAAYWHCNTSGINGLMGEMKNLSYANRILKDQLIDKKTGKLGKLPGYDEYKMFNVVKKDGGKFLGVIPWEENIAPNPTAAAAEAKKWGSGYSVAFENCLNNTYKVLNAYGAREKPMALMSPSLTPPHAAWTPRSWFRSLNVDGGSQKV